MSSRTAKRVPGAAEFVEQVLRAALRSIRLDHREEHRAALGVLAAVLAEVRVLADVGVPRRRLLRRGDRSRRPT